MACEHYGLTSEDSAISFSIAREGKGLCYVQPAVIKLCDYVFAKVNSIAIYLVDALSSSGMLAL